MQLEKILYIVFKWNCSCHKIVSSTISLSARYFLTPFNIKIYFVWETRLIHFAVYVNLYSTYLNVMMFLSISRKITLFLFKRWQVVFFQYIISTFSFALIWGQTNVVTHSRTAFPLFCCCCWVIKSYPTPCDPMYCSTRGFPIFKYLPELAQTHVHWVADAIQPSLICHPLLLLPSIFPSIIIFSSESTLHIRWPKYWSFSFSICAFNEHSGLVSFTMDWFDFLAVQETRLPRVLSSTTVWKHQFFGI